MIKAVIFDKDGVIVDSIRIHHESFRQALIKHGINLKWEDYKKNMAGRKAIDNIRNILGKISDKDLKELIVKKTEVFKRIFSSDPKIVPGVIAFIKKLKKRKIHIGLATSSRRDITDFILTKLNIISLFDVIVTSDEVADAKPNPELFLTTASKLKISPGGCVVFEDSFSGVKAAKAAGMKVVLVMTSHSLDDVPKVSMSIKDFTKISVDDVIRL